MDLFKPLWKSGGAKWQLSIIVGLISVFILTRAIAPQQLVKFGEDWSKWFDASLTFGTVLFAIFIWYNEHRENWRNDLPKRLHVIFLYQDAPFYEVLNAPLTSEGDIRAWGQQLGRQMNGVKDLEFGSYKVKGPNRSKDSCDRDIMQYILTIWLDSVDATKAKARWTFHDEGSITKGALPAVQP